MTAPKAMKRGPKVFASGLPPGVHLLQMIKGVSLAQLGLVRPMQTTVRLTFIVIIFAMILFSSGCQKETDATNSASESTPGSTKPLEAAGLVGYDGTRLRKSVDRVKEANEKHNQQLEKMVGSGPEQ
jgi:hypothetical protein